MTLIHNFRKRVFSFDQGKYLLLNLILTLFLSIWLELLYRRSVPLLLRFMRERTFLFLFNGLLIFTTLSVVLLFRKKIFAYTIAGGGWMLVGLVNALILSNRKTPFTAVDLTIARSALPIIRSYLSIPQIILAVCLITLSIAGAVCLFLYTREQRRDYDANAAVFWIMLISAAFVLILKAGTSKGILARKFDNLIDAYRDYGVAYGFFVTAVDTGIDRPLDYSQVSVNKILKKVDKRIRNLKARDEQQAKLPEKEAKDGGESVRPDSDRPRRPNIVFLQLESFFDAGMMKNLSLSGDPVPNLHRLQKEYTHGMLKVPVYGAGTINTEFEVITGMNLDHFGSGEYPFRSILHKTTCDGISYWLADEGYVSTVVHNNNASFYDRDKVYSNLGFDHFVSIENMNITERNEIGWPKDSILQDQILDVLQTTGEKDLIYAISIQGHGDYPTDLSTESLQDKEIRVTGTGLNEEQISAWTYYINEAREMDALIGTLTDALSSYPEEVVLVVYGDHLPGMNIESGDLKKGTKYQTPYLIWDNFGWNRTHAAEQSGTLEAWQLAARVLQEMKIYDGVLNRYHQTMSAGKKYKKNLRVLEYDMLYGNNFVRRLKGKADLPPSKIRYGVHDPVITGLKQDEESDRYVLYGRYFTDQSRVYADHIRVSSEKISDTTLLLSGKMNKPKEISVVQVSASNGKIHYNESEPWLPDWEALQPLTEEDPAWNELREREQETTTESVQP